MHRIVDTAATVVLRGNPQLAGATGIRRLGYLDLFEANTPAKQLEDKFQQAVLKRDIMLIEANSEFMDRAAIQQTCKLLGIEEPPAAAFAFPISIGSAALQGEVTDSKPGV